MFIPTWQTFAFWRNKDKFLDSSLYFIAIMYTIVAQKVTQCFRKYKKPYKRSENPIHHIVCLITPSIRKCIDKNAKNIDFQWHTWDVKYTATPFTI